MFIESDRRLLQCVTVCCSGLLFHAGCNVLQGVFMMHTSNLLAYLSRQTGKAVACVAVCCSVLQCVAVCCRALQCVAVRCSVLHDVFMMNTSNVLACLSNQTEQTVAMSCSVLQCVAGCIRNEDVFAMNTSNLLEWVSRQTEKAVSSLGHAESTLVRICCKRFCSVVQCVAVCCSEHSV